MDAFDQFEMLLREFLSGSVVDLVLQDDDPMWNLIDMMQPWTIGGRRTDNAADPSAGYEAQWRVRVQQGGRMAGGQFDNHILNMAGPDNSLAMGTTTPGLYLDSLETPLDSWIKVRMILKRIIGDIAQNHQQITAQLASEPIEDVAARAVENAVSRLRAYIVNYFWSDGTGKVATVDTTGGTVSNVTGEMTGIGFSEGTFARFKKGDQVQFVKPADPYTLIVGGGGSTTGKARVVNIDRTTRTVMFQAEEAVVNGGNAIVLVAGDIVLLTETYTQYGAGTHATNSLVQEGVESLLINTGDFPGAGPTGAGLDVNFYSDLKAEVRGDVTNPENPTPESVAEIIDTISDGGYAAPEAVFAERSLWTLYAQLERDAGAQYVVPQGAQFNASGGVDAPRIGHMGNSFQRFSSIRMNPGEMDGLALDTWMKFMPMGNKTIMWVYGSGPLAGFQSIFGPVFNVASGGGSTRLTEQASAPLNSYCQFGCDTPGRNFRRVGYKSQRTS